METRSPLTRQKMIKLEIITMIRSTCINLLSDTLDHYLLCVYMYVKYTRM